MLSLGGAFCFAYDNEDLKHNASDLYSSTSIDLLQLYNIFCYKLVFVFLLKNVSIDTKVVVCLV